MNLETLSSTARGGYEDWELDQNVRQMQAKVGTWRRIDRAQVAGRPEPARRAESAPEWRRHAAHAKIPRRHKPKRRQARRSSALAACALAVGLMAFACGTALLVLSFVEGRDELWSLGLPIAVAGQVGLLVGLVLQLERIWQNSRDAVGQLDQVHAQLRHLERATSLSNVTHGSAAQAFYAHMAEDAHPQVLLADLKGQLDLLAISMSRR